MNHPTPTPPLRRFRARHRALVLALAFAAGCAGDGDSAPGSAVGPGTEGWDGQDDDDEDPAAASASDDGIEAETSDGGGSEGPTCPVDGCASCGDGICSVAAGESCETCPDDCECEDADPCATAPTDGTFCGAALGGEAKTLYACEGGVSTSATPCVDGCATCEEAGSDVCRSEAGQADALACSGGVDPCATAMYGSGGYCGQGLGGVTDALYQCADAGTVEVVTCDNGCAQCPPFVNDVCKAFPGERDGVACGGEADPCASATLGNGGYCGETIGGTVEALYECTDGTTTAITPCAFGCAQCPPGVVDVCRASAAESDADACDETS